MVAQKHSALAQEREKRAAEAMRENLRRRKQQQQARAAQAGHQDTSSKKD